MCGQFVLGLRMHFNPDEDDAALDAKIDDELVYALDGDFSVKDELEQQEYQRWDDFTYEHYLSSMENVDEVREGQMQALGHSRSRKVRQCVR